MEFIKHKLKEACEKGIITDIQSKELEKMFFSDEALQTVVKNNISNNLYYLGGFVVFIAMIWMMSNAINNSTYLIIFILGSVYAVIFLFSGEYLWKRKNMIPSGILYLLFALMITFLVMVIEKASGFYPHFSEVWKYDNFYASSRPALSILSISLFFTSYKLLIKRKNDILVIPLVVSVLWFLIMAVPVLYGNFNHNTYIEGCRISLIFSILLFFIGWKKDKCFDIDYSKWLYLISAAGFYYSAVSIIFSSDCFIKHDSLAYLICGSIGFLYIVISILIQRQSFMVLGMLGFIGYIFYLEVQAFEKQPIILSSVLLITGLFTIYFGIFYFNKKEKIEKYIEKILPEKVIKQLPKYKK